MAQGSILTPTLFNLYVNDIIKNTNTQICLYADDTAILSRHRNLNTLVENIKEHLAHLEIWFSVWKIAINSTKTEVVFFSKRHPPLKLLCKTKEPHGLSTPIDDDNLSTAPIMAGKVILGFVQSLKNIMDADSEEENEISNAAPVPMTSEKRNIIKRMRNYSDAHSNGEMNIKMEEIEQSVTI
ncbi:RNA-directed DNA polymerase from mobile element jockey [Trichonephila clavipes]|nr:RNA-directed DNA polymerase from mobile element jockey [Trichonephila clavipes]